ncbi:hypothetical protein EDB86DRAFT_1073072 [Lactarius hatsudake]|nr:hypothetical protein EDB86DRAFT_1073072 [Lactarius hatsudake]
MVPCVEMVLELVVVSPIAFANRVFNSWHKLTGREQNAARLPRGARGRVCQASQKESYMGPLRRPRFANETDAITSKQETAQHWHEMESLPVLAWMNCHRKTDNKSITVIVRPTDWAPSIRPSGRLLRP